MTGDAVPDIAIFYADGSIVECSNDDKIEVTLTFNVSRQYLEAPAHGVQAIVERTHPDNGFRQVCRGSDYYYPLPNGVVNHSNNMAPFFDHHLPGVFKYGLCIEDDYWNAVMQKVKQYTRIPRR
jgi:hypothetical protein